MMLSMRNVIRERLGRGAPCIALKHKSYIRRRRSILLLRMLWVSVMPRVSCLGRLRMYQLSSIY